MKVTALLVSHDGARWLPAVVQGLEASTRLPSQISWVDTGSTDETVPLLSAALGLEPVLLPAATTYADAVAAALAAAAPAQDDEWIWLLHDDARPAPDCLEQLMAVAESGPAELAAVGPKLREWPSLKRLLEVGVTISGSGRRETGLEPGEYDQGQHDEPRTVLAVHSAGMLIRRDLLEQFGFDPALPIFGTDLDLGWRLNRAGHQIVAVPDAVMFHAEGAHRGRRRGALAQRPHRDERAAALHTLLANSGPAMFAWRWIRLLVAGVLRTVGHLLVREPSRARDEIAAVADVHLRPGRLRRARAMRRAETKAAPDDARAATKALLAPAWMPLRHGLDFVAELGRAVWGTVREAVHVRTGAGPERSVAGQLFRSPTTWALAIVLVGSMAASRHLLVGDPLHGGALLAAPDGIGQWWSRWAESWHWVGPGTAVAAPPYLLPLAVLGTVLFGQPGLVTFGLFVATAPLAFGGAVRFLRRIVRSRPTIYLAASAYALAPVVSGAVSQGRVGAVAAALVLPWTAGAALRLGAASAQVRARAVWRTALGAALITVFVPAFFALVLVLVLLAPWLVPGVRSRLALWPVLVAPLVVLLPWLVDAVQSPRVLLLEAGRAAVGSADPTVWELLAGRLGGPGAAPWWFGLGIVAAAIVALFRIDRIAAVARAWVVAALGAVLILAVGSIVVSAPGLPGERAISAFGVLLMQGALLVAIAIAVDGVFALLARSSFTWHQPVLGLAVLGAVGSVVLGAAWWGTEGTPGPLDRSRVSEVPVYMADLANSRPDGAVLQLTGGPTDERPAPVSYTILRADALRLGDDAIATLTPPSRDVTDHVQAVLVGEDGAGARLAAHGIAYVYAPAPVSDEVSGAFDAADGFVSASATSDGARAWRVTTPPDLSAVDQTRNWWHFPLIAVQFLGWVALLVLAAPNRRREREES